MIKETTNKFSSKLVVNELVTITYKYPSIGITLQEIFARSDEISKKFDEIFTNNKKN